MDVALALIALPIFIAAGWPLGGWAAGAGAWVAQRMVSNSTTRRAAAARDVRTRVGLLAGSMIGRGWLVALTILLVGLADRRAGLSGAVLFLAVLTTHLIISMVTRPFDAPGAPVDASAERAGEADAPVDAPAERAGEADAPAATRDAQARRR